MKRFWIILAVAVFVFTTCAAPYFVLRSAVPVTLTKVSSQNVSLDIFTSGVIDNSAVTEGTVPIPLVVDDVTKSVGDPVCAGERLATVDRDATQTAILNLLKLSDTLPEGSVAMAEKYIGEAHLSTSNISSLLEYIPADITAPSSGVLTEMNLSKGVLVYPKTPVCKVAQSNALRAKLTVSEEDASKLKVGDTVVLKANATDQQKYAGKVTRIFPAAYQTFVGTSQETVVGFYASLNGDLSRLKAGYSVSGVVSRNTGAKALILPYSAVSQDDSGQEFVYLFQRGRAVRRNITESGDYSFGIAAKNGVSATDIVIRNAKDIPKNNCLVSVALERK